MNQVPDFVVITGGEPAMYDLTFLTHALHEAGMEIAIETSGAYPIRGYFSWVCLSPKKFKMPLDENYQKADELKMIIFNKHDLGFRIPGQEPRYPGSRMGVEAVLREGFLRARAYRTEWTRYEAQLRAAGGRVEKAVPPRRDLRLETLAEILDGKILVHAHAYRADEMLMLMKVADDFGFKVRTFEHGLEAYKIAGEIARHGAGVGTFIDWWGFKMETIDAVPYNPAILARHGVSVALDSDLDELARRLYWDAAKAVKYGRGRCYEEI